MSDLKEDLLSIVKKNIDVPGLVNDTIDQVLEPALRAAVAKSETKIDDVLVGALYQLLEDAVKEEIAKLYNGLFDKKAEEPGELV